MAAAPGTRRRTRAGSRRSPGEFVLRSPAPAEPEWQYTLGPRVCDWIEEFLLLPSGDEIGQPFVLMEWQREFIYELFRCSASGELRYTWALLGVPKGNGKSPLAAALALYHAFGDDSEPDPWVVMSAASDKQADIVFDAAKKMCELSPLLSGASDRFRWEIRPKGAPGKIERVAASKGKLDGKIVSLLIIDELHEWDRANWVVLTGGARKRRRTQIVQITTAGYDRESICYKEYEKGLRIASGEEVNPTYLFRWYGAPEGAPLKDLATWRATNPAWDRLVHEETLSDLARNIPENDFRRYRLNQWVKVESAWLPLGAWDACRAEGPVELVAGEPTAAGWDASTKRDSTAITLAQPWRCEAGELHVRVQARVWERPMGPDGLPLDEWRIPMAEVTAHARAVFERYDLGQYGMGYDPAFVTWEADELEATGLNMIEFPQSPTRMVRATGALYDVIAVPCSGCGARRLQHDGDPVLARHVAGTQARQIRGGGSMLEKGARGVYIDAVVALAMAVSGIRQADEAAAELMYVPGAEEGEGPG